MTHTARQAILALMFGVALATPALAQETCKKDDFGTAVDSAGATLRKFNLENQPKLNAKLEALRAKKGWKKTDSEDKAADYLQDGRIAELDNQANDLLTKIDALGRTEDGKPVDCAKLSELKAAGVELLAVMKAKSTYTMEKIDIELGGTVAAAKPSPPPPSPPPASPPAPASAPTADTKPADVKIISKAPETSTKAEVKPDAAPKAPPPPPQASAAAGPPRGERLPDVGPPAPPPPPASPSQSAGPRQGTSSGWETSSDQAMLNEPYRDQAPGDPYAPPPGDLAAQEEGYTIEEIRDATRGFFGTISTNLAAVIEHAFSKSGRPTAYILGQEGGGAFLAGLRYGDGTLFMRSGGAHTEKIYWHGPSVGYDFGAEGSRTLFLIYKLHEPSELYRSFTGIDGSAYVVGGVGLTLLKGGKVTMAPIRTGIGLRIGANLGYLRFTPKPTWNPF